MVELVEFTTKHETMLQETRDATLQIRTVLLGAKDSDDKGLVGQVNDVCQSHSRLKRSFFILVGVLVGSGILGTSIWAAFN